MAIKEYRVQQANMRPIYRRRVPLVRDLVGDKTATKEAARLPLAEGQAPIAQQGRSPNYDAGSIMGLISSLRSPGEVNPAFDPNKPIGGENVPYKGTSGAGGVFSRIFGNRANELNVEAQQQQAAEMRDKALSAEERKAKREDELALIAEREKGPTERFKAEQKRLTDKEIRDEIAREDAINLQLAREGERDILSDIDMARKEANEAKERALRTRELDIKEQALKPPRYSPIGNTGLFQTPEGELAVFEPEVMRISDAMPGRKAGFRMLTGEGSKAPKRSTDGAQVDRATGAVLSGGPLPSEAGVLPPGGGVMRPGGVPAEPVNTALLPRFGRAVGETLGGVMTSATDPMRYAGTELYKQLISSRAQQDPEVLKRLKKREEESSIWDIQ